MVSRLSPADVTALLASMQINQTVVFSMEGDDKVTFTVTQLTTGFIWTVGNSSVYQQTAGVQQINYYEALIDVKGGIASLQSVPIALNLSIPNPLQAIEIISASYKYTANGSPVDSVKFFLANDTAPDAQFVLNGNMATDVDSEARMQVNAISGITVIANRDIILSANKDLPGNVGPLAISLAYRFVIL